MGSLVEDRMWPGVNQQIFADCPAAPSAVAMVISTPLDQAEPPSARNFDAAGLTWQPSIASSSVMETFLTPSSCAASCLKCGPPAVGEDDYREYDFASMQGSSISRFISYTDLLSLNAAQLLPDSDMASLRPAEDGINIQPFTVNASIYSSSYDMEDDAALSASQASGLSVLVPATEEYHDHGESMGQACGYGDEDTEFSYLGPSLPIFNAKTTPRPDISGSKSFSTSPSLELGSSDAVQYKSTSKEQPEGQNKAQVGQIKSEPLENLRMQSAQEQSLQLASHNTKVQKQSRKRATEGICLVTTVKASRIETPPDVVHVRARRGQATDSHSLAERVRREKISQRMKVLQEIVPGCHKVLGKAMMLDEIINYVKSLQKQVEFLSMKLALANQRGAECIITNKVDFFSSNMESFQDFLGSQHYIMPMEPLL